MALSALKDRLRAHAGWPAETKVKGATLLYGAAPVLPGEGVPGNFGLGVVPGSDLIGVGTEACTQVLGPEAMDEPFQMAGGALHAGDLDGLAPWFAMAVNEYVLALIWRCIAAELKEMGLPAGKIDPAPEWEGGVGLTGFTTRLQKRIARELPEVALAGGKVARIVFSPVARQAVGKAKLNNALLAAVLKHVVTPYLEIKNP